MRVLLPAVLTLSLFGCAAGPQSDAAADCVDQGYQPGTEVYRACVEGGGAAIATGPGSPYAMVDEEESSGTDAD